MTSSPTLSELAGLWFDPLSDEELNALAIYFDQLHHDIDSMNLSMIDGFFTSLALSLAPQMPEDWLERVVVEINQFTRTPNHADMIELLFRHYQQIKYRLCALNPPEFEPMFLYHEDHEQAWIADWCYGFMQGIEANQQAWEEMESVIPAIELILAFSTIPSPDETWLEWDDALAEEDQLFYEAQQMAKSALEDYQQKMDPVANWDNLLEVLVLVIRDQVIHPAIEETCPCGSGKPFLTCCGAADRLIH